MRSVHRVHQLRGDGNGVGRWNRALCDAVAQRGAVDQLHDDRTAAIVCVDSAINLSDVRMIECGEQLGFPLESLAAVTIGGKQFRKNFDRDFALLPGSRAR